MNKITDRFLLGVIAGLGGNIAKIAFERLCVRTYGLEETGAKKAAGIFLRKGDINTLHGRIVGNIADSMIACGLGVSCSYSLSLMGKDYYLLKGAGLGAAEWAALYGVMSNMGATRIFPTKPKDALIAFASHVVFGTVKMIIVTQMGDERLFKPANIAKKINEPQELKIQPDENLLNTNDLCSSNRQMYCKN